MLWILMPGNPSPSTSAAWVQLVGRQPWSGSADESITIRLIASRARQRVYNRDAPGLPARPDVDALLARP